MDGNRKKTMIVTGLCASLAILSAVSLVAAEEVSADKATTATAVADIKAAQNLAYNQTTTSDSYYADKKSKNAVDGVISDEQSWVSNAVLEAHWLEISFPQKRTIKTADVYTGLKNEKAIENFVFQTQISGNWQDVPQSKVVNNNKHELRIEFDKPVETDRIRLYVSDAGGNGQAHIREICLWAQEAAKLAPLTIVKTEPEAALRPNPKFDMTRHQIFINQCGFNTHWPKRFTAPLSPDGSVFSITPANSDKILYSGTIVNHIGDFSGYMISTETNELVIRVTGGGLKDGVSVLFSIKPFLFEEVTLANAVYHFVDDRSITGTHNGAFGAAPWRDAPFYAYCVPSLVAMYLANPVFFDHLKPEMDWNRDMQRVLAPDFVFNTEAGENSMEVVARMYKELDGPVGDNIPDIIQLIHWGISWWHIKPKSKDYAGSENKIHPETYSEFAYFLYGYPYYKQYFTPKYYKTMLNFAFDNWKSANLLEVDKTIGTFKGRYTPGWTILPNLMMYETAKREGKENPDQYLQAAINQTKWIIDSLDFKDPLVTKGQRMSEHKMMSGLYALYKNYPEKVPAGFLEKMREWADIMIGRSDNMWDFRKYDDDANWSLPRAMPGHTGGGSAWNEPGNLAGFPAIAWNVCEMLSNSTDDLLRKKRLNEIAVAQIDNLYGRNPLGYHTAFRGVTDFKGVEAGWPIKYNPNVCARLHKVRGTICSSAATEHYPFNPEGKFRHPEGWTAFNAALNMGLAAATRTDTRFSITKLVNGFELTVYAPVFASEVSVTLLTREGEQETLVLPSIAENTVFRKVFTVIPGPVVKNDGKIEIQSAEEITLEYGFGYFKKSEVIQWKK